MAGHVTVVLIHILNGTGALPPVLNSDAVVFKHLRFHVLLNAVAIVNETQIRPGRLLRR